MRESKKAVKIHNIEINNATDKLSDFHTKALKFDRYVDYVLKIIYRDDVLLEKKDMELFCKASKIFRDGANRLGKVANVIEKELNAIEAEAEVEGDEDFQYDSEDFEAEEIVAEDEFEEEEEDEFI